MSRVVSSPLPCLCNSRKFLRLSWSWLAALALLSALVAPTPGRAFEAIDGRFEAHGYFEMQLRTISRNYGGQWDLTQWYNVFNLELELDLVQDTHGILDLLELYVRIEARYDCIYSHGCGMIEGVDVYGNDARNLPARLNSGTEYTTANTIFISDDGPLTDPQRNPYTIKTVPGFGGIYEGTPEGLGSLNYTGLMRCTTSASGANGGSAYCPEDGDIYTGGRVAARFWNADRNLRAEGTGGAPGEAPPVNDGTDGAPYLIAMEAFRDFKFASVPQIGGSSNGHPLLLMGPWSPENFVELNATLANIPHPLDSSRVSPQSLASGFGANPMRPIPIFREDDPGIRQIYVRQESELSGSDDVSPGRMETINPVSGQFGDQREWNDRAAKSWEARGLFQPSPPLKAALAAGGFGSYPFNISEIDRAFNRGASQQDEGELKEAYLDIEMFDSRLWLRVGKQNIVWGKTELFRTTDQFNPQDLALATLPNLEESRIALWSMRGVWSFYEVGALSDVRLEVAINFDQFESADLGACGEPYAVNLICGLTFGSWAHGMTGLGVAGIVQPPDPWEDPDGMEFGVRLEWRWDRFSFAITDFYGYDDFPHTVRLSTYNRNVDWQTGRPRHYMQTPQQMADVGRYGCATPDGQGVDFLVNPVTGGPDLTQYPTGVGTRISYGDAASSGCLTPGATNRAISQLSAATESGNELEWGVPFRVDPGALRGGSANATDTASNSYSPVSGHWLNDSALSDADDPRRHYSRTLVPLGQTPTTSSQWPDGPQAHYCDPASPDYDARLQGLDACDPSTEGGRGRRIFDTRKFITVNVEGDDVLLPNPGYNPFYDPRFDRHFDVGDYSRLGLDSQGNPCTPAPGADCAPRPALQMASQASPGDVIATEPVLFDPFRALTDIKKSDLSSIHGLRWWGNAYNPEFDEFDPRNALDNTSINASVFNFICAVTVGFSDLDPSACALTVFTSSKKPSGGSDKVPRISYLISSFLAGSTGFGSFLGVTASDEVLSKGPLLPRGLFMPAVGLNVDLGDADLVNGQPCGAERGCGKDAFRTTDIRRNWWDQGRADLPSTDSHSYPWIYGREAESYNCLSNGISLTTDGLQLCGGLAIGDLNGADQRAHFNSNYYLSRVLTPEQEALLGCGPYFGTNCDLNGADLMWAEASALLQSFLGSDSLGIALTDLGIVGLVSGEFGTHLADNGSPALEYRTDPRVIGENGELLRVDGDVSDPSSRTPALGSNGYLAMGNPNAFDPVQFPSSPCNLEAGDLFNPDGSFNTDQQRAYARCWDLRDYYKAYGIQPGTAAFEVLGLGGPRCTTADIGGPLDPTASVLPGCRNKWATIQYRPLPSWDGDLSSLHPNNPDAGFLGNNWYGQIFSYKAPRLATGPTAFDPSAEVLNDAGQPVPEVNPRTDYRQWRNYGTENNDYDPATNSLAALGCGTGDPSDVANYDCYVFDPTSELSGSPSLPSGVAVRLDAGMGDPRYDAARNLRRSGLNWGVFVGGAVDGPCDPSRYSSESQMRNDPNCYLGGWRQTVDGDPDRLGLADDPRLKFPEFVQALGWEKGNVGPFESILLYGERVEGGCTPGSSWIYLQRTADGELLGPAECANVYRNPTNMADGTPWSSALSGGAGHPFTGESFANELSALSWNLLMLLVTFSPEFSDGLASVRGFVHPELYESRYIYDEEWMWNPDCDGTPTGKSAAECGGRLFVEALPGDQDYPVGISPTLAPYSAYGSPNRDPATLAPGGRVRQVTGWRSMGVTAMPQLDARATHIPNPLPEGVENKRQRDPSLPNIMTMFPDYLMRECTSARMNTDDSKTTRELYEACGSIRDPASGLPSGAADWTINPVTNRPWQELRLGQFDGLRFNGGLVETLQWDYAFTGTENDLMAMIPYCEDLAYTQRHFYNANGDKNGGLSGDAIWGPRRIDCSRGLAGETLGRERCTYITPQFCSTVQAIAGVAGQKRNVVRAAGNQNFGRRTFQWQSGSEIYLAYNRRNVLGFSMDFAEDYTKSNWSMEFTWIEGIPFNDSDSYDLVTEADDFNLTVSVDRPTFINFLNANRTFFFNSQWFFQYRKGYRDSFTSIGPWNVLATFAVFTGYFQDRLNPTAVFVWDFRSSSGGFLPQVSYRFSENFSMTVGASVFMGEQRYVDMRVNTIGPASPRSGPHAYQDGSTPGLSVVRDRDEVFMTLRYTF